MDQKFMVTQRKTEERKTGGVRRFSEAGRKWLGLIAWMLLLGKPLVPGVSCCLVGGGASSAAGLMRCLGQHGEPTCGAMATKLIVSEQRSSTGAAA